MLYVVLGQYSNDQFAARAATSLGFGFALQLIMKKTKSREKYPKQKKKNKKDSKGIIAWVKLQHPKGYLNMVRRQIGLETESKSSCGRGRQLAIAEHGTNKNKRRIPRV